MGRNFKGSAIDWSPKVKERNVQIFNAYAFNGESLTLIGRTFHLSKERVRQIVAKGYRHIRKENRDENHST